MAEEDGVSLEGDWNQLRELEAKIREALFANASELLSMELGQVQGRTPVAQGGLLGDVMGETPDDGETLAYIYSGEENQMSEWGRFYALYQEGGDLGMETYTNSPHEMFGKILTDDIPNIEAWGNKIVQKVLDEVAKEASEGETEGEGF